MLGLGGATEALERIADALEVLAGLRPKGPLVEPPSGLKEDSEPQVWTSSDIELFMLEAEEEKRKRKGLKPLDPDERPLGPVREDGTGW